jgi:hypothetical protein
MAGDDCDADSVARKIDDTGLSFCRVLTVPTMPHNVWRRLLVFMSPVFLLLGTARPAAADTAYGLLDGTRLIVFDTTTPGTITATLTLNGLQPGEVLVAIDIRPATGEVYGLGSTNRLYVFDLNTATATAVSTTPFSPALTGASFGMDFDPTADELRVISDTGQQLRLDPNTGLLLAVETPLAAGGIVASAYTDNFSGQLGPNGTTLYGIDAATDRLILQGGLRQMPSPNTGVITTVGPLGVDTSADVGFDVTATNRAFASLTVSGVAGLYSIDLSTGAATPIGPLGNGTLAVKGLAVTSPFQSVLYALTASNRLVSFLNHRPETLISSVPITCLQPGETLVAIDTRPQRDVYGVSSAGRLYVIDPVTGFCWTFGPTNALTGTSFGMDFDPVSEQIRVVSDAGQNIRINANTGVLQFTDTPIVGQGRRITGLAYSNNVRLAMASTLFGIDANTKQLVRIGGILGSPSAGSGSVTDIGPLGVNTTTDALGFDITPVDDTAYAALNVGGFARLYQIDLTTGAAQPVGTIGTGDQITSLASSQPARLDLDMFFYRRTEGGILDVTILRSGPTVGPISLTLRTATYTGTGNDATSGIDYTPVDRRLVVNASSAQVSIPLLDDNIAEALEAFLLRSSQPGKGNVLSAAQSAVVFIQDDDGPDKPPTLTITSPTSDPLFTVNASSVTVAGTASDEIRVDRILWSNNRGGVGQATGTENWTIANIPLQPGENVITVTAVDASELTTYVRIVVMTPITRLYTLAEGATGTFFDTDILLANPSTIPIPLDIEFLREDGVTVTQSLTLPGLSRQTLAVDAIPGLENTAVSTNVLSTSGREVLVERTMRWDASGYGAHTEKATPGPSLTWYFAEGSQGFFQTYLLLSNPGAIASTATVRYLLQGSAAVTATYPLTPRSRRTIFLGDNPALVNQSFGITVTFDQPGVAERAMYFGQPLFSGGHESAGETAPSKEWFLAEGATGNFFTTFVLLANPQTQDAQVTLTYLPASGESVTKVVTVPSNRRETINLQLEDASLEDAAVATHVQSSLPIIVERAQYWPGPPNQWYEAHNAFGMTSLSRRWGLAEGRVGGLLQAQTYILLANPDTVPATVTVEFLREPGRSPQTILRTVTVPPTSRVNIQVANGMIDGLTDETFGAVITSPLVPVAVERALYMNANGIVWAAGTNATGTRLQYP